MELILTEEQLMLQATIRKFVEKEVKPAVEEMEKTHKYPTDLINKMGQMGLMGIPIDKKYSGGGMDFTSYVLAIHELSKESAALGVILSVHTSVGTKPIIDFGTEEQIKKYVPKLTTGEYIGAFALTEPSAGSDAASLKTTATKKEDHYVLNGSKVFITNGNEADTFITFAKTAPDEVSAFIVERNSPGLKIGKNENKMGLRGTSTVELFFENCIIPIEQQLGKTGEGFKIAMANLNVGRIGIAAQALGIAEGALNYAAKYAKERKQFDKPISHHQGISFKLADMATQVEAARLLTYQAANLVELEKECRKEVSMAKMFASKTAMNVAIEAVQILGGYGYTEDYPVERFFRDAKVTEIYEGTNEIQHLVISKELLK